MARPSAFAWPWPREFGLTLDVAGVSMHAFPLPRQLLGLDSFHGLSPEKIRRLHDVPEAALDVRLDPYRLRQMTAAPGPGRTA